MHPAFAADLFQPFELGQRIGMVVDPQIEFGPRLFAVDDERGGLLAAIVAAGEAIRLWAVLHIGTISRTRSDRLGPLVASGPFGYVRNPLYLGNILLWTGFSIVARLVWLTPLVVILLALEYHAIVRWEEQLLATRIGDPYVRYVRDVPRWLPSLTARPSSDEPAVFSWRETLFSERGTLIAIAVGFLLLWIKARF